MGYEREFPWRRVILMIMLASLVLAAALGVLATLATHQLEIYQIIVTGVAAAACAYLLLSALKMIDARRSRSTGLLMAILVVIEFLAVLIAIWRPWEIFRNSNAWNRNWRTQDMADGMALAFGLVAVPLVFFFYIRQFPIGKLAGWIGVALCVAGLGLLEFGIAFDLNQINETGTLLVLYAPLFSACAAASGKKIRYLRWIGLGTAAGACTCTIYRVFSPRDFDGPQHYEAEFALLVCALLIAHANLLDLIPKSSTPRWLRVLSLTMALGAGILFILGYSPDRATTLNNIGPASALAICATCGSVALAVIGRFNRTNEAAAASTEFKTLAITCPHCSKPQTLPAGESNCGGCGLRFSIQIHEPRCAQCGYLLLMIQSDRCPECGSSITPLANQGNAQQYSGLIQPV